MPRVSLESQPFITGLEISPAESEKPASVAINGGIVASDRAWSSELLVDGQLVKIVRSLEGPDELDNRVGYSCCNLKLLSPVLVDIWCSNDETSETKRLLWFNCLW